MNPDTTDDPASTCAALAGAGGIASGSLEEVARAAWRAAAQGAGPLLIFDDATSRQIELDLRGSEDEALARLLAPEESGAAGAPRGPGRPRLGVVAREITLLPRHWDWLAQQAGGASVAIRKLVEEARRT